VRELLAKVTLTEATGTGGVSVTDSVAPPLCPSLVAMICAEPTATALTTPDALTVATPVLLEVQAMLRPESTLLLGSRSVALAVVV
jgi:hypothetical protein